MAEERSSAEVIEEMADGFRQFTDIQVTEALSALPPLADESDSVWEDDGYWRDVAHPYLALADVAAERRIRAAIPLLLDRACFGDPGEIMRGLRHNLEAIVNPDWDALTELCLAASRSSRLGTRLWAINELAVLDDPRAEVVFREAIREGPVEIASMAEIGLERLGLNPK